jgi:hypothetical protein
MIVEHYKCECDFCLSILVECIEKLYEKGDRKFHVVIPEYPRTWELLMLLKGMESSGIITWKVKMADMWSVSGKNYAYYMRCIT